VAKLNIGPVLETMGVGAGKAEAEAEAVSTGLG
jgi:hypothetical protein